ncbi:DUF4367 domain-containing protein [Clostridium sp. WILCCON 0269]|uniref:DUF4367 domain-containing protein n=1 Tax=Candidatus Clostridium eludens TaxID=3381663 RepID=A0ABW8SNR5_9CLOT
MKDNMKNLREITDLVLKDIHVTEKLKRNTLEKCKSKKRLSLKPIYAISISAAIMILIIISYQYHHTNFQNNITKKYIYNNPIAKASIETLHKIIGKSTDGELKSTDDKTDDRPKNSVPSTKNSSINSEISLNTKNSDSKSDSTSNDNDNYNSNTDTNSNKDSTLNDKGNTKNSESEATNNSDYTYKNYTINAEPQSETPVNTTDSPEAKNAASTDMLDLATAQSYLGSTISMPSYIPENFKLTNIYIPKSAAEQKTIIIDYNDPDNKYFKLTQSKQLSSNISGEKISISDETQGYLYIKSDETDSDSPIIQIAWIKNDIEYTLYGNISKDSMLSIAKSIN